MCKVDDVVDIDARKVNEGCVGLRVGAPPLFLMIYNTRALLLEDFVRLLRKLTERRKIGNSVRFRYTPEQVLESQRIEREQAAAMTSLHHNSTSRSAAVPKSVSNVLGDLFLNVSGGHTAGSSRPVHLPVRTSPGRASADGPSSTSAPGDSIEVSVLHVSPLCCRILSSVCPNI